MFTHFIGGSTIARAAASIENISFSLSSSVPYETTTNLSKGQVVANCVPFFSYRNGAYSADQAHLSQRWPLVEIIDNGGTPAVFTNFSESTVAGRVAKCAVVEFNPDTVRVQKVAATIGSGTSNTATIPIAIDTSKTFLVAYGDSDGSGGEDSGTIGGIRIRFTNSTTITLDRVVGNATHVWTGHVYVVEDISGSVFDVQHNGLTIDAGLTQKDITLASAVDYDKSFMLMTAKYSNADYRNRSISGRLYNSNTVRMKRTYTTVADAVHTQVITFKDGTTVTRKNGDNMPGEEWTGGGTDAVATRQITTESPFDITKSIVVPTGQLCSLSNAAHDNTNAAANNVQDPCSFELNANGTQVTMQYYDRATLAMIADFDVITFNI